jgi:hypothetical protein
VDPEQFQDPDNEYGLFAGTTYEADDEEADKIYEQVDKNMDARRRARRCVNTLNISFCVLLSTFFLGRLWKRLSLLNIAQSDQNYNNSLLISSEVSLR